jgi:PAS domain S-box-containing protein
MAFAQAALDNAVYGVAFSDSQGKLTYVNDAFREMWGYDENEKILGTSGMEFWKSKEKAQRIMKKVREKGHWIGEIVAKKHDGSTMHVQLSAHRVMENNVPSGMMASFVDVTARKKAEEDLRQLNEELEERVAMRTRELQETNKKLTERMKERNALLAVIDNLRDYDKSIEEALQNLITPIEKGWQYPNSTAVKIVFRDKEYSSSKFKETPWVLESCAKTRNGEEINFQIAYLDKKPEEEIGPFLKEEHKLLETIAKETADALSAREVLDALRESESLLRIAIEKAAIGMVRVRPDGTFVSANNAFCEMSGYSEEELINMNFQDLTHPDDRGIGAKVMRDILEGEKKTASFEKRYVHKDSHVFHVELQTTLIHDDEGEPLYFFTQVNDITERKIAQQQLERLNNELEQRVKEKTKQLKQAQEKLVRRERLAAIGELSGGIAHELRNPLGAIKNSVYFLKMAIEEPDEDIEETLQILEDEVKHSVDIIESLLEFSKPKPPTRMKVNINEVLNGLVEKTEIPDNIKLSMDFKEEAPILLADPVQLERVFGNLIGNAIEAMPKGGRLDLATVCSPDGKIQVKVKDTGTGIPEDNLESIFEPLFTTKAKGIGLGLSIVNSIIEAHSGSISVESEVGRGTVFTVELPLPGAK